MRHRVGDDVDPHRVGPFLGVLVEVLRVFALALPAIAKVVVVTEQRHQPAAVIKVAPEVRRMINSRRLAPPRLISVNLNPSVFNAAMFIYHLKPAGDRC